MEKLLQTKALKILTQKNLENINKETFNTIISLTNNNQTEKAQHLLDKIIKHQTRKGTFEINNPTTNQTQTITPINFIQTITNFLTKTKNKQTIKKYIKPIKKTINYLETHFDETYLLLYTIRKNTKTYYTLDNAILISNIDELVNTLNEFKYDKKANKLFQLKGKLELGFNRYFYQEISKTNKQLIKKIKETGTFKIANTQEQLKILKHYNFETKFLKNTINKTKQELINFTQTEDIINYLTLLKQTKNKQYKQELKKQTKALLNFPEQILNKQQHETHSKISKSLNSTFKEKTKQQKQTKQILTNTNNIKTINQILKLINN